MRLYERYIKRILDILAAVIALIVLSPLLFLLTVLGVIFMRGNPFYTQLRPGKDEKIFKLIKFRSMTNKKDRSGKLLPDKKRLKPYGLFLRKTSLDELPELLNILKGDMSLVGPRPLAVSYLKYYNSREKHRHDVMPGLTGLAQVNGRAALNWEKRFQYDLKYVDHISFLLDARIVLLTMKKVLESSGVVDAEEQGNFSDYRKRQWKEGLKSGAEGDRK